MAQRDKLQYVYQALATGYMYDQFSDCLEIQNNIRVFL